MGPGSTGIQKQCASGGQAAHQHLPAVQQDHDPHHKTRCVPGNRLTSTPLLTKLHKAQNVSFLHLVKSDTHQTCRWWVNLCTIIGCSWFPAAGLVLLCGKPFINSVDPTPALVPLLFHLGTTEPHCRYFTEYFWTPACAQAEHIPAEISSKRMGRGKRAKGCRILNHTLCVSQPDVQRESCVRLSWHSLSLRPPSHDASEHLKVENLGLKFIINFCCLKWWLNTQTCLF